MNEFFTRLISGAIYIGLLLLSLYYKVALSIILFIFGIICVYEFSKLIRLKSKIQYLIFIILYSVYWYFGVNAIKIDADEAINILLVITVFVNLFLLRDLFVPNDKLLLFNFRKYIVTTFYLCSGFIFLLLVANFNSQFTPNFLLGTFILIWINDSAAYVVGKNFGKQKLFLRISPKKTVEGFLGGLLFACISSYFIAIYITDISQSHWLILAIIISVFGTLGDLIESSFKRQANVKDSGIIMPGHGGLFDRLDSLIFVAPFIYLFLRISNYVS